ncbi:hypothetical protein O7543_14880 [Solwaraspora sp. WMMA2080]|uniref:hypothetical protein n=1 Tax=unclassified Solwaraspora TaxID=2627926 RepID=UPI00248CB866|nr:MULTISPECIES: hypothetical protein [unclassified Solwaraspora]WBB97851.1 hypothetical protein O7553_02470 [Solwaraspora sp. WMMA2059]WBC18260.1 hypothetical protein O7543_14880 [Solwaraspora sp. WMMA2080]
MVRAAEEVMSGWVAFGWVVAIAAGGGLVVLGLIWPLVRGEQSRDAQLVQQLRADLLPEAARTGWVESEPAPELTRWGLGTVVPDEKRCCLLASQQAGHQAALIWCVHDDNDGTLRYTVLLVGPAVPVPAMEIRRRFKIFSLLRPGPTGQETDEDARFAQTFKIVSHADPDALRRLSTGPVRRALHRLHELGGLDHEPIRLDGRAMRVVLYGWPRLPAISERLTATIELAAALSTTGTDDPAPAGA